MLYIYVYVALSIPISIYSSISLDVNIIVVIFNSTEIIKWVSWVAFYEIYLQPQSMHQRPLYIIVDKRGGELSVTPINTHTYLLTHTHLSHTYLAKIKTNILNNKLTPKPKPKPKTRAHSALYAYRPVYTVHYTWRQLTLLHTLART